MKQGNWRTRKAYNQDVHRRRRGGPPSGHYRTGSEGMRIPQMKQPGFFANTLASSMAMLAMLRFSRRGKR